MDRTLYILAGLFGIVIGVVMFLIGSFITHTLWLRILLIVLGAIIALISLAIVIYSSVHSYYINNDPKYPNLVYHE